MHRRRNLITAPNSGPYLGLIEALSTLRIEIQPDCMRTDETKTASNKSGENEKAYQKYKVKGKKRLI
jgi:hypothetical protein